MLYKVTYSFLPITLLIVLLNGFCTKLTAQNKFDTTKLKLTDTAKIVKRDSTFKDTAIAKTKNVFDSRVKYTARDSMVLDNPNEMIYLYGLGTVNYETMDLKAGRIVINNKTKLVNAEYVKDSLGNKIEKPAFNDGSQAFDSEKMAYNMDTKKGKIFEALTKQENLLVFGKAIKKDSSKVIYVKDAKCIPCEYADAQTYFQTNRAKIIPDDKVVTGPVFLVLAGIPTPIGLPFGFFPSTKRKRSGIIIPKFRDAAQQGIGLTEGGYYWGINDYTDLTVTGDVYSTGTWKADISNRYLINYKMSGNLLIGLSRNKAANGDLPGVTTPLDYNIVWNHAFDQKFLNNARFSASVNYIGRRYNKLNQIDYATTLNNNVNSGINYSKSFKNFTIGSSVLVRQDKTTGIVSGSLPQLNFTLNPVKLFPNTAPDNPLQKLQVNYFATFNADFSTKEDNLISDSTLSIIRSGLSHKASISHNQIIAKYFNISNGISVDGRAYFRTNRLEATTNVKGSKLKEVQVFDPRATVNVGYNLSVQTTGIFGNYYYKSKYLKQIRHRMDPSVSFNYTPYLGDKFYNQNKSYYDFKKKESIQYSIYQNTLYGGPGTSKSGNIGLNLSNTFEAKVGQKSDTGFTYKKINLLNALSVNTAYNIFAKANEAQWSPLSTSFNTSLFNKINVQGDMSYSFYGLDTAFLPTTRSYYQTDNKLLRFLTANININTTIDKNFFISKDNKEKGFENFNWSLSPNFACNWIPDYKNKKNIANLSSSLAGTLTLTKNWGFTFNTGYNFKTKLITYTTVGIKRDLRCWQMGIDWIPFGINRSYNISLNLKNAMFQNFKIPRQRNWQDNGTLQN